MNGSRFGPPLIATACCAVIGAVLATGSDYVLYVATAITWLAIMAISFDVVLGYTGYLSLAHGS